MCGDGLHALRRRMWDSNQRDPLWGLTRFRVVRLRSARPSGEQGESVHAVLTRLFVVCRWQRRLWGRSCGEIIYGERYTTALPDSPASGCMVYAAARSVKLRYLHTRAGPRAFNIAAAVWELSECRRAAPRLTFGLTVRNVPAGGATAVHTLLGIVSESDIVTRAHERAQPVAHRWRGEPSPFLSNPGTGSRWQAKRDDVIDRHTDPLAPSKAAIRPDLPGTIARDRRGLQQEQGLLRRRCSEAALCPLLTRSKGRQVCGRASRRQAAQRALRLARAPKVASVSGNVRCGRVPPASAGRLPRVRWASTACSCRDSRPPTTLGGRLHVPL